MQNDLILTKEQFANEAFRHYLKTGQGYNYEGYLKWVESEELKERKKKEEEQSNFDWLDGEPDEEEGDYENDQDVYTDNYGENYNEEENYTAEELRDVLEDIIYEILAERNKKKTKKTKASDIQRQDNNNLKIEEGNTYVVWSGGSCEQCKGLNGNIYELGDELPETHPNCKCELTVLDKNLLPTEESIPLKKWNKNQKKPKPIKKIDISKITFPNEKTEGRKLPVEEGGGNNGKVSYAGWQDSNDYSEGYGQYIRVDNEDGTQSYYAHMKEDSLKYKVNDIVNQGDILGNVGDTGGSDGVHLHYTEKNTDHRTKIEPREKSREYLFNYYNR